MFFSHESNDVQQSSFSQNTSTSYSQSVCLNDAAANTSVSSTELGTSPKENFSPKASSSKPLSKTVSTPKVTNEVSNIRHKSKINCNPNDIGLQIDRIPQMTDAEKLKFADDIWKPKGNYAFPKHEGCGRSWLFNISYLTPNSAKYYPWLAYSVHLDGVFCVLFGHKTAKCKIEKLFTEPLTRWNGMNSRFQAHDKSELHKAAMDVMLTLKKQRHGEVYSITTVIDRKKAERIEQNRNKILPVIKTVIFCAKQNIPMRGHRDDPKYLEDSSNNPGNFQALLQFRVDSGDTVLENYLKTCPKYASYRLKTVQNEIVSCIGNFITRKLADEIKRARFFPVIADEVTDASTTEQMSLVIRFIDDKSQVREKFIRFIECESTGAEYLVFRKYFQHCLWI